VAKELGLAYNTLHRWVKEYKESNGTSFVDSGNIKPQNQEIIELRRRNQELEEELAILKKALGIFTRSNLRLYFSTPKRISCCEDVSSARCFKKWVLRLAQACEK
jgi:transposase